MANRQLADNLSRYREACDYTQDTVSHYLNISRQAYSNYERGKRDPDLGLLMRLCELYHLTLDQLVLMPFNNNYLYIREDSSYTVAKNKDSPDELYISEAEMEFLLRFREADEDVRSVIEKLLKLK